MTNEDTEKLRSLIKDMRVRVGLMRAEANSLLEQAKMLEAESYTIENKFQDDLFPPHGVESE